MRTATAIFTFSTIVATVSAGAIGLGVGLAQDLHVSLAISNGSLSKVEALDFISQ